MEAKQRRIYHVPIFGVLPPKSNQSVLISLRSLRQTPFTHQDVGWRANELGMEWNNWDIKNTEFGYINIYSQDWITGVYDTDNDDITSQYINIYSDEAKQSESQSNQASQEQQQLMEARLDSMTTKMDQMMKSMQNLQEQVNDMNCE